MSLEVLKLILYRLSFMSHVERVSVAPECYVTFDMQKFKGCMQLLEMFMRKDFTNQNFNENFFALIQDAKKHIRRTCIRRDHAHFTELAALLKTEY